MFSRQYGFDEFSSPAQRCILPIPFTMALKKRGHLVSLLSRCLFFFFLFCSALLSVTRETGAAKKGYFIIGLLPRQFFYLLLNKANWMAAGLQASTDLTGRPATVQQTAILFASFQLGRANGSVIKLLCYVATGAGYMKEGPAFLYSSFFALRPKYQLTLVLPGSFSMCFFTFPSERSPIPG